MGRPRTWKQREPCSSGGGPGSKLGGASFGPADVLISGGAGVSACPACGTYGTVAVRRPRHVVAPEDRRDHLVAPHCSDCRRFFLYDSPPRLCSARVAGAMV